MDGWKGELRKSEIQLTTNPKLVDIKRVEGTKMDYVQTIIRYAQNLKPYANQTCGMWAKIIHVITI